MKLLKFYRVRGSSWVLPIEVNRAKQSFGNRLFFAWFAAQQYGLITFVKYQKKREGSTDSVIGAIDFNLTPFQHIEKVNKGSGLK